ncbi:MAG: type II toxin-antitoxin system PemK/MazF family toxin [Mariprofundaceae bacterium]|nr:type II toxin-antitoxin system PemK/MazF family toxin [Mariprofundaceae bacterium]
MVIQQYDIWLVNLDPTIGSEIQKTRPCVIISPQEMNRQLRTIQISPMTSNTRQYPWQIYTEFHEKKGAVALDQIRCIDKRRLVKHLGALDLDSIQRLKKTLHEMLID